MIAMLGLLVDLALSCHCSPHGWTRGPLTGEWRCIAPLAHTRCAVDVPSWHEVQGIEFCSRDCGEEPTTS